MNTHEQELLRRLERCQRLYGSDDPSVKMLQEELRQAREWMRGVRPTHEIYHSGFIPDRTKPKD